MKFDDFIQKGQVRKGVPDVQLSKSLIKDAENDLRYLKTPNMIKIILQRYFS